MPSSPPVRCPDCKQLHSGTGRCPDCRRQHDAARGRRQERGYDAQHDALGRSYQRRMDGGERFTCWRCGRGVGPRRGVDWQLGHCDEDKARHHGPEHTRCNEATSGRAGKRCPHRSHGATRTGVRKGGG